MAQDPEGTEPQEVDPSHDLDLVTLFSSSTTDAELEANNIHGVLEASGIPSFILGTAGYPSLEWRVQVPQAAFEDAERLLAEARAAGPEAAAEAEAASEGQEG
jgi:hypothetical protein